MNRSKRLFVTGRRSKRRWVHLFEPLIFLLLLLYVTAHSGFAFFHR